MSNRPKVSVIIPTYNCAQYLSDAVESVLRQTVTDLEIIIVDDGSTDNTAEVVQPYLTRPQQNVRYHRQDNQGPGAARNAGIVMARAEYVAFLDADDCYGPRFIEESLECLQKNGYDVVTPQAYAREYSDGNGRPGRVTVVVRDPFPVEHPDLYAALYERHIGSQEMVVRKECFDKCGLYDDQCYLEDWDIWLRFAEHKLKLGLVPGRVPLWTYRVMDSGRWSNPQNESKRLLGQYAAVKKHKRAAFSITPAGKKIYARHLWDIGKRLLTISPKKLLGLGLLLKSQIYDPNWRRVRALTKKAVSRFGKAGGNP